MTKVHGEQGQSPLPDDGFGNLGRSGVAVWVPPGVYRITKMLQIQQSNVVVRGAGINRTVLYFPDGLKELYGDVMEWQWEGGFLNILGPEINSSQAAYRLGYLTASVTKGATRLPVTTADRFRQGQWVRLWATNPTGQPAQAANSSSGTTGRRRQRRLLARQRAAGDWVEQRRHPRQLLATDTASRAVVQTGDSKAQDSSLDAYLYGYEASAKATDPFPLERLRFASRVAAVGEGWIELERPLPLDLHVDWQVEVHEFKQAVQHSGWEGLTLHFALVPYPAHFTVAGMNGFYLTGAANCWVRDVHIINADQGAEAINTDFTTLQGISLGFTGKRRVASDLRGDGHHGLWTAYSSNNLITQFAVHGSFQHDITLDVYAQECVVSNGSGLSLTMDMHRGGIFNNLWTYIDLGFGSRPLQSGGSAVRGAHAGANNTWWNLRARSDRQLRLPPCNFGPLLNFIGPPWRAPVATAVTAGSAAGASDNKTLPDGSTPSSPACASWMVEATGSGVALQPPDLHLAMRSRRLLHRGLL
ncbi:hypothetical protein ABPG77_000615 [Micractinium sp. CCAP 211/92]